ncbi:MAG: aminotransferase class I/II-fold pyridoxal phosphate-dependent enzyme [Deltaproteobacteria bacterium]|nr:aminotransferase class I/II-fold pyridoxal phosphate-dependent enzyme [Deltaproteobacteria bacterium]
MKLADRMQFYDMSGVRKLFELAAKMKDPVDLSLGLPDFDAPQRIKDSAMEAIQKGKNRYTMAAGIPELRKAIEQDLMREGVNAEATMAISGASGGLVLALLALADSDTEVLVPDPYFITYPHMVRLTGAPIRFIDTYPDFRLTPEKLQTAVNQMPKGKRRVLIFNSPVNPSGIAYRAEEIRELASCARLLDLQVISDEVYNQFSYDFSHHSWLKHDSTAILIRTFGKTWGMTGWRCGYAAGPKAVIDAMTALQQFIYVCVNAPSQWASVVALQTEMKKEIESYRKKRDFIYEQLKGAFKIAKPEGAFYAFPEMPCNAERFQQECLKREVLIVPGGAFSQRNTHFRISFALSDEKLKRGVELLLDVARACQKAAA